MINDYKIDVDFFGGQFLTNPWWVSYSAEKMFSEALPLLYSTTLYFSTGAVCCKTYNDFIYPFPRLMQLAIS